MISERIKRSEIEIAGLRALHARQRAEADAEIRQLLVAYTTNQHRAAMLRAIAASAFDQLAQIVGQMSVASLCCAMSTHFIPEIAMSSRAKAEAIFLSHDDQEAA